MNNSTIRLLFHAGLSAFLIYFCMYAFRKPFAAATFSGEQFGLDFKVLLVIAQVVGYATSKFIGIRFNSGLGLKNKAFYIILFISLAELALLGFAIVPKEFKFLFIFLNGLPLGMIWGFVFAYLEGRTITELLAAMLSASFIISSGVTKSVGKWLMNEYAISEYWMPFLTGAIFFLPMLIGVWLIEKVPPPNKEDLQNRKERVSMTATDRKLMFQGLAPGLIALMFLLFILTAFRDLRDNFAAEFWQEVGYGDSASVFAITEIWISIGILLLLSLLVFIKNNAKALAIIQFIMLIGLMLLLTSTLIYHNTSLISPFTWMTISGLGIYMAYVMMGGSIIFERITATFPYKSNAAFLIYLADAIGYLGSVIMLLFKDFFFSNLPFLDFYRGMIYLVSVAGLLSIGFSFFYFKKATTKAQVMKDLGNL